MKEASKRIFALTKRNLKEILREPVSLIFLLGLPLFLLVLFYYIFHNLTPQFEMQYLAPGIIAFSQAFLTLFVGLLMSMDRASAFLIRLYVTPAGSYEFIAGYMLAMLPVSLVQSVLFFITAGIIEPSFFSVNMIWGVLCSLITAMLYIGFGILFGSLCNEKAIGGIASIVISGQSVLSGMWFPLEGINKNVITVMNILPFRPSAQFIQHIVSGSDAVFDDIIKPLIIVLAYTVVITTAGILIYNVKMKRQ
ncbi:MAG: ABC transporter permease [Clostridia bacterium]|nr:ABC transporter permease [Clostridia bacterium]